MIQRYISLTRYFLGITSNPPAGWLSSRPLIPLLVAPLAAYLYIPLAYGIINTFFWIGSAFLIYLITIHLTGQRYAALGSALLLSTSPPTLLYFGSVMLEGGGTFFTLLILWLYIKLDRDTRKMLLPLVVGLGVLAKESTLPALASIILLGIVNRQLKRVFKYAILLLIPVILWQIYTTFTYGENYITHYLRAGLEYSLRRYGTPFYSDLVDILKALALGHFPLAAPASLIGFLNTSDKKLNLTFYALLAPALLSYTAWPFRDLRIAVVTYYATMPMAGLGVEEIIRSLTGKPLLGKISPTTMRILLYLIHMAGSILYVYSSLGRFSLPWDIYLFAPSSLQAGL